MQEHDPGWISVIKKYLEMTKDIKTKNKVIVNVKKGRYNRMSFPSFHALNNSRLKITMDTPSYIKLSKEIVGGKRAVLKMVKHIFDSSLANLKKELYK